MRKKYIYIYSRLEAELRGGDPFAMQVTPHPPRGIFQLGVRVRGRGVCVIGAAVVDDAHADTGKTYLPCTIARLHISRDAQHVITRAESKKTIASRPANRRSRANESEPTRPMAGPRTPFVNPV